MDFQNFPFYSPTFYFNEAGASDNLVMNMLGSRAEVLLLSNEPIISFGPIELHPMAFDDDVRVRMCLEYSEKTLRSNQFQVSRNEN